MYHEVDIDLPNNRKSRRLAVLLSERRAWTRVLELWLWADVYALDGDLCDLSDEDLAHAMGYRFGDAVPKDLRNALILSGFLDESGQLHGWADRGKYLKKKRLAMRRLRASRGDDVTDLLPLCGDDVTPDHDQEHDPEPPPYISPPRNTSGPCTECATVSALLLELTGVSPRVTPGGVVEKLHARHREAGVEACLDVVRLVVPRLMASDEFKRFARTDTLFGPKNFPKYRDEVALARQQTRGGVGGLSPSRREVDSTEPPSPEQHLAILDHAIRLQEHRIESDALVKYPRERKKLREELDAMREQRQKLLRRREEATP